MIRPFTCLCALLAGVSGLYLYSEKHRTTLLDQQISRIVADTQATRERTAMLRAEWTLLNQPDRLSVLSARFLPQLQPIASTQLVALSALNTRLPLVGPETPPHPILTPETAPGLVGQVPVTIPESNSLPTKPDTTDMLIAHADLHTGAQTPVLHRQNEGVHTQHGIDQATAHQDSAYARKHALSVQSDVTRLEAARAEEVRRVWNARIHSPTVTYRTSWPVPQVVPPNGSSLGSVHGTLAAPVPISTKN